ncbi:hypothetical protein J3R82DRAFT_4074 [Butyriboletus roseoflavus]|nr:hypothetical protein J3R82DRAFT_4074 [Butyriboletus roseoflavus]
MPPNTLSKVKVSRKRKRTDRDAIPDESVNFETDATELELQRNKKHREEDQMHRLPYLDPAIDKSLSEQSRKALSYAYERCRGSKVWKFNKARQNWLLRNVWSEQAVSSKVLVTVQRHVWSYKGTRKLHSTCDQVPGWHQGWR